jgi:4-hydroxybenzoyl-CoA thioesterase
MTFETEFDVRFGDVDYARVVYYPRFFHFFHQALEEWFGAELGLSYSDFVTKRNLGLPTVRVESEFVAPLRYGDRVSVSVAVEEVGTSSVTLRFTAVRLRDGATAARARIKKVFINNDTFASVPVPDDLRERLSSLDR